MSEDYAAKITVSDIYLIVLWDTNYFEPRPQDKRLCGRYIAEGLYSIEAFSTNNKPEHKFSKTIASKLLPSINKMIMDVESELKKSLSEIKSKHSGSWISGIEIVEEKKRYVIGIPKGRLVSTSGHLLRIMLIQNEITERLKNLALKGAISTAEYKKIENIASKPIRKLFYDLNLMRKKFHSVRRSANASTSQ